MVNEEEMFYLFEDTNFLLVFFDVFEKKGLYLSFINHKIILRGKVENK